MTKIIIGDHDRIILKNSERRVAEKDALGYVFVRKHENVELRKSFTHDEIKALIDAGEMSIDVDWYEHSHATARCCLPVLATCPTSRARNSSRSVAVNTMSPSSSSVRRRTRRSSAPTRALARASSGHRSRPSKLKSACNRKRLDQWPPAPSARNFRRWLKTYEDRGAQTLALRMKHRQCGNRLSNSDPEMSRVLEKVLSPTVAKLGRP